MVKTTEIRRCNARFANENNSRPVCVLAGATSGIGASTIERLAHMLYAPIFYVVGRSAKRFAAQRVKLERLNPNCKIVFLEAEFSILSHVDAVCEQITAAERRVDYLYMSPGLIPVNGAQYTIEGLETCFAISYYSRIRLTYNLLPLLRQSPRPRVLSVLNGGKESRMREDDLGLEQHWTALAVVTHSTTMTSLAFEHMAEKDKQITFLHAYPGWVRTDNFSRLTAPESSGVAWRVFLALLRGFVAVLTLIVGISVEDGGERQAFHLTSDKYDPGASRIGHLSDKVSANNVLKRYREQGWSEKVWEHNVRIFDKALAVGA